MAYPVVYRQKALEALKKGYTQTEVNKMFGLSNNVLKKWKELEEETGSLEKRPLDRKPAIDLDALRKYCEENPLATHIEAGIYFGTSERNIRYAKDLLGITRKKRQPHTLSETSNNEQSLSKN
ncbi:MAG: IS630 transposase-related protein [Defluviitaleaceae bacterium]|nr:IS630 transposase-related protein [Defluviitaleaceae bacterium]